MERKWIRWTVLPVLCLLAAFIAAVPAFAAQKPLVDLGFSEKESRYYTQYDVTGDGKADKFLIGLSQEKEGGSYGRMTILINGAVVFQRDYDIEGCFGTNVKLITVKSGRVFIYLKDTLGDFNSVCALFKFNGKKLIKMYDFRTLNGLLPKKGYSYVTAAPTAVSGNVISFHEGLQCPALGTTGWDMKLVYKGGKFQLTSRYAKMNGVDGKSPNKKYKLRADITAYPTATAAKVGRKFRKGTLLRVTQLVIGNGFVRFKVINSAGRYGYVSILRGATVGGSRYPIFEGLDYAG